MWISKYGNNNKYQLSICVTNPFFKPEEMNAVLSNCFQGKRYTNINILPYLQKNSEVNDLINSLDIDLTGLSGAEGWNLPAFNATCLGKWSIVLNETSHKDWSNENNCISVPSSKKYHHTTVSSLLKEAHLIKALYMIGIATSCLKPWIKLSLKRDKLTQMEKS